MFDKLKLISSAALMLMVCSAATAVPADADKKSQHSEATADAVRYEIIPTIRQQLPLSKLAWVDNSGGLALTGASPKRSVYFTVKRDDIITDGEFDLYYTPSPSLLPVRSQLNVYLNGILQKSIALQKENIGNRTHEVIKLDAGAFKDENIFDFELIGHYTDVCENPVDSTIWLNISAQSSLNLCRQQLHIANDLSFFPVPFFNVSTPQSTVLSMVFSENLDNDTIKAASVIASYGGVLTKWRGADYPAYINKLPSSGHAVVFVTNDSRPDFLKDYRQVKVPTVEMMDIPHTVADKMLVISAPDSKGLVTAAKALALGNILFNGPVTEIHEFKEIESRLPYDAPNWVDTSKPFTLGSITTYEDQLSAQGYEPPVINVELNLPPDLYFVNGSRIDMNLMYKYSKPPRLGMSQLRFMVNDHLIRSYPLNPDSESDVITTNMPLLGSLNVFGKSGIDTSYLKPMNVLSFDFKYSMIFISKLKECITTLPIPNRVEIDPASTLDFTGIYHFTKMPNLSLFWQSGYPFSIYADLQETAAVIEDPKNATLLTTLFNTAGRIGAQLGFPAVNLTVLSNLDASNVKLLNDKDILILGQIPDVLSDGSNAKVVLNRTRQALSAPFDDNTSVNNDMPEKHKVARLVDTSNFQGIGAAVSFESPLNSNRTVVALFADSRLGQANINRQLVTNHSGLMPAG
ncbi:MAG: cellulose biosynthesis cyclic di-GMP-binding regulatory protein BcsB, partial [Succinivibrio sp.]